MRRVQQHIRRFWNNRWWDSQQRRGSSREPPVTDRAGRLCVLDPIRIQIGWWHATDLEIVRHVHLQQTVSCRKIANLYLEVHQDLEQRRRRTLSEVDNALASRVPTPGSTQPTFTRKRCVVANAPQEHLRCHALIHAVQQFFDEASAGVRAEQLKRAPAPKLSLGRSEPPPSAFGVSEYLLGKRGCAREADCAVRLALAQSLLTRTAVRQRPSWHHKGIHLIVRDAWPTEPVDNVSGQPRFDDLDEILIGLEPLSFQNFLHALQHARLQIWCVGNASFSHRPPGQTAHNSMASCSDAQLQKAFFTLTTSWPSRFESGLRSQPSTTNKINREQLQRIDRHDLRHEGACRLLTDGVDIRIIQLVASIQQTQRYLNVTDEELRRGLEVSWNNKGRALRAVSAW
jgi:hypothetical protein